MVEFALIIPLLILFILGIIEVGYALFIYTQVENAAREGARAAAVRPCPSTADTTAIVSATRDRLPALVDVSTINPAISYPGGGQNYGDEVRVAVNYQFQLLDPLTTVFIPQVNVNAVASRTITTGCSGGGGGGGGGSPTDTPTVGPSPTATTIGMCTVPNLVNGRANAAPGTWSAAGFSGAVTKNGSGNFVIASQSLAYGSSQPCTSGVTISDAAPTNTPTTGPTNTPTTGAAPTNTPTTGPTNTPTTGATPTNTTTPMCTVPNFIGTKANNAQSTWNGAGFSGTVTANGPGNFTIDSQSLPAGSSQPCTSGITVSNTPATNTPTTGTTPTTMPSPTQTAVPTNTPTNTVMPSSTQTSVPTNTPTPSATPTCAVPSAPSLSGTRTGSNVNLSWNAVANATSYQVYRSSSATGPFSSLTTTATTSAGDSIPNTSTYRYYVIAMNSCGQSSAQSNTVTITR
jgi:hypothetical protein